jgi:hypothetical protein
MISSYIFATKKEAEIWALEMELAFCAVLLKDSSQFNRS